MHKEQRRRTVDLLRSRGIGRALFADMSSIKWLTGFAPEIQLGPALFAGGPPLLWLDDGRFTLVVVDGQASGAAGLADESDCAVATYQGYTIQEPIDGARHLAAALRSVLGSATLAGPVGVESRSLTLLLAKLLEDRSPQTNWVEMDGWLVPLRAVKTDEELAVLRKNFDLVAVGHRAARQAIRPGVREIDVWTEIHSAVERAAGRRVPLGNDCNVGYRQFNIGAWPLDNTIRPHDSFIVDLSTCLHGYWSDSCVTYYADGPTKEQIERHRFVQDALDLAISLVRPGVTARSIDQCMRQHMADAGYPVYPHHTGHGVGVLVHEEPRIVPYNEMVLEPGMVVMLEPGIYYPGEHAVRLEDAVLVTADGAEVLTSHDKSLPA